MSTKNLKIAGAILFTSLFSIYLTFGILSFWMLYVLSFPSKSPEVSHFDQNIGYVMFSALLLVSLICSAASWLSLRKENASLFFTWPTYLFLPIGVPYWIVKSKIKNDYQKYEINDKFFSKFLLIVTSFANYFFSLSPLIVGTILIMTSTLEPLTLYFGVPVTLISLCMIIGTTANIINYLNGSDVANTISYIGFTFVWVYKIYKISLRKNNLISQETRPIKAIKV